MSVPDEAGQLGGIFTCPFCRAVTTLAPVAKTTASTREGPDNRVRNRLLIVVGVIAGSLILVNAKPVVATLLGAGIAVLAVLYVLRPSIRGRVDRLIRVTRPRSATVIAVLVAVWSFFVLFLFGLYIATGGPERARAERAAQLLEIRKVEEKKVQDEAAARQAQTDAQVDAKLNEAEALLGTGELDRARQAAEQAKELNPSNARAAQIAQKVAEETHRQRLATLPERHAAIARKVQAGLWRDAGGLCTEARAIDAKSPLISATCAEVDAELRKHDIVGWIAEANRAATEKCDTPAVLGEAWKNLKQIRAGEAGYVEAKKAASKLEKCRKSAERTLGNALRELMIKQRTDWAARYEAELLDSGMDVRVTLQGKNKDQAKIRWVLLGRAMVHQITKDGSFLANLEKIGFRRVTFSDGFYESWYYDLDPQSEDNGGAIVLRGVGLDEPIKM